MITRRDLAWLAALAAAGAAWLAPAWLDSGAALANFGDLYGYHIPHQHLAAARLAAGELPFWNAYIFAGMPHLASPQAALFYPPAALLRLFPLAWAFTAYQALHLLLAAAGAQLLARRLGAAPAAAAALGAAYALSPFVAGRVLQGVPTHLAALAWVPWCWLALRAGRAWLLAGCWALQGLSGHPQFAAINALAMAAWAAADPRGRGRAFALAAAGAAAMGAVQAVPTARLLAQSSRVGLPEEFLAAYSMPPRALAVLASARAFGDARDGTFSGLPSEWCEEYTLHLGIVPLALAGAGALAVPAARSALALAAAGAALAVGRHAPWWPAWRRSPLATLSRVPARWAFWTLWGLWLAAAAGAASLARSRRAAPARGLLALVLLAEAAAGAGLLRAQDAAPYLAPNREVAAALGGRALRALTAPELPNADKTMLYRIMNVNGYEAFYPARFAAYAARSEGRPAADPARAYLERPGSPEMRALGVAAVLPGAGGAPFSEVPGAAALARFAGRPHDLGGGTSRVHPGVGRPAAQARSRRPESWEVSGSGPGPLVLAVPFDAGWRAWVNGTEVRPRLHDGLVMEVDAPEGPVRARFRYAPPLWPLLCAASVLAWAAWGAAGREALAA